MTYFTIGHSNRTIKTFIALLQEASITLLADVRSVPRSRYNPQFNDRTLEASLAAEGIAYRHLPKLGGMRGDYAQYMQTPEFHDGIAQLEALHEHYTVAFMCAEAKWWECHRRYIAAHLTDAGNEVRHLGAPVLETLPLGF